jgi:hypothetical protein
MFPRLKRRRRERPPRPRLRWLLIGSSLNLAVWLASLHWIVHDVLPDPPRFLRAWAWIAISSVIVTLVQLVVFAILRPDARKIERASETSSAKTEHDGSSPRPRLQEREKQVEGRDLPIGGPPASDPTSQPGEPPSRHLAIDLPERAPVGARISLLVRILLGLPAEGVSVSLKPWDPPMEGAAVMVTVSARGLIPLGDLEQELYVPAAADSEPARFSFTTARTGLHTVTVRAFAGGTILGELAVQILVEVGAVLQVGPVQIAEMDALATEPGEVTLLVGRTDDDRYSFQLLGEAMYPVEFSKRLTGDPAKLVNNLAAELRMIAAGTSLFTTPALVRNRLQNLGAELWTDAVPEAVRRQFWEQADRVRSLTIISETDILPWELVYPIDKNNDGGGFLVELFPVLRRVYRQSRARWLPLSSAAFVVPRNSPGNAMDEVWAVRRRLGAGIVDRGVVEDLRQLIRLLDHAPSIWHFACHNKFTDSTGSIITMAGGPFRPNDLSLAVQKESLANARPLIFLNACRTAGEVAGLMHMMGWANQFMGAGAGAFLGSLWAVKSNSAKAFADAFYQAFISQRLPLGDASLHARRAIMGDGGDPTWLAYTVYGNPAATIGAEGP